jgi:uncharacterized glyoxalase superfamily protein PhnB
MNTIELKGVPTFRILDYQKAIEFYVDFIGFKIDWEHRFGPAQPIYMQISKHGLVLHLTENKRFQTNVIVFVDTKGIVDFHKELCERNPINDIQEISRTNWKTLQLEIEDPFGNLLRFNEAKID